MDPTVPASEPPEARGEPARKGWRTFRALRHRNYRLYFIGQIVSMTGTWVQTTALTWLAWDLTKQSVWPGLVSAAQAVPLVFLGPWGGSLADRWPRWSLIFAAQAALLVLALLLGILTGLGDITPMQLLIVSL